ncbi:uncharacterized protein SPSK_10927 [Sporothrix schenckii 1099-18]|uniref:Uncharacterized protein n=1 Tax=Sporothrix schenckii 1099-18 TaxID=1397361 RepID=A0A0F2M3L0_SPOSC|nr:uncharacterized protein SPSK_10927 [Sporothrix schenckii 1099-18]KJR84247.1 hypothetical protein SPSK_10927 [Sporothrix schenckii 1099-18]
MEEHFRQENVVFFEVLEAVKVVEPVGIVVFGGRDKASIAKSCRCGWGARYRIPTRAVTIIVVARIVDLVLERGTGIAESKGRGEGHGQDEAEYCRTRETHKNHQSGCC